MARPGDPRARALAALISLVLFSASSPGSAASEEAFERARAVLASGEFIQKFDDYLGRTTGRSVEQVNAYLESAIEDILLDKSQVSPTALTAEIRHFSDALVAALRACLCGGSSQTLPGVEELKVTLVFAIDRAAEVLSLDVSPGYHGRIAGILVNIFRRKGLRDLCLGRSFSELE